VSFALQGLWRSGDRSHTSVLDAAGIDYPTPGILIGFAEKGLTRRVALLTMFALDAMAAMGASTPAGYPM
jgi:hypothetical protein